MTYDQLLDFVQDYMPRRMPHIYLPLLVGELVDSDGSATIRQLAEAVLVKDESQVRYYKKRLKEMPLRVLSKHDIITHEGNLISLNVKKLTFEQKSQIKMLCEKALRAFTVKKGLGIWDYRLLDTDPIPDSLRYRVLKESGGRCSLCGATKKERPVDVDHIKPRSKGGKNEYENLQVLCSKCNRSKGNKDDTDFRGDLRETVDDCPFCYQNVQGRIVDEYNSVFAIKDAYPVSDYHMLIIPKRHSADYFSLTDAEKQDADKLIQILRKRLLSDDKTVTGFNIGMNSGESAGQTIFHCHLHLIPRRDGDIANPRGGVRGVIPEKMGY
jgi:ATP adenylyltransferase